jgi:hypothetical protein
MDPLTNHSIDCHLMFVMVEFHFLVPLVQSRLYELKQVEMREILDDFQHRFVVDKDRMN